MSNENIITIISETTTANGTELRSIICDGFIVDMLKPANAPKNGDFLPLKVLEGEVQQWSFQWDHPGYKEQGGMAMLKEMPDGKYAIVLIRRRIKVLDGILPLSDLPHLQKSPSGELVGGRKLSETISLKQAMAKAMQLEPAWTERELRLIKANEVLTMQKRKEEQAREASVREARHAQRLEKQRLLLARKEVVGYTVSGSRRTGIPVVGDEWLSLPVGKYAIEVTNFDTETGVTGTVTEAFQVIRKGDRKLRDKVTAVTSGAPARKTMNTTPFEMAVMIVDSSIEEVMLVANKDDVATLRKGGLNSGTLVAYASELPEKYQVVAVKHDGIHTVGYGTVVA